jgi:hypothetical protein
MLRATTKTTFTEEKNTRLNNHVLSQNKSQLDGRTLHGQGAVVDEKLFPYD